MTRTNRTGPDETRTCPACPAGQTEADARTDRTHPLRGVRLSGPHDAPDHRVNVSVMPGRLSTARGTSGPSGGWADAGGAERDI